MLEVPIRRRAVVGRVLAHGRDSDAIVHLHLADLDRREESGRHFETPLRNLREDIRGWKIEV
jgi:hypothetical protein